MEKEEFTIIRRTEIDRAEDRLHRFLAERFTRCEKHIEHLEDHIVELRKQYDELSRKVDELLEAMQAVREDLAIEAMEAVEQLVLDEYGKKLEIVTLTVPGMPRLDIYSSLDGVKVVGRAAITATKSTLDRLLNDIALLVNTHPELFEGDIVVVLFALRKVGAIDKVKLPRGLEAKVKKVLVLTPRGVEKTSIRPE